MWMCCIALAAAVEGGRAAVGGGAAAEGGEHRHVRALLCGCVDL